MMVIIVLRTRKTAYEQIQWGIRLTLNYMNADPGDIKEKPQESTNRQSGWLLQTLIRS
jgi:hypothetical protein